jgi:hypothetical protein
MVGMADIPVSLPVRVRCGASFRRWNGDGWLTITSDGVTYQFSSVSRLIYSFPKGEIHARPPIMVVTARFLPPGLNSAMVLRGEGLSVRVLTWWGVRGRVQAALAAAKIPTVSRRTWLTIGTRLALRESPNPFRRGLFGWVLRVALVLLTLLTVSGAVLYLTVESGHIPSFLPGYVAGSSARRIGLALICMLIAAVSMLAISAIERRARIDAGPQPPDQAT